MGAGTSTFHQFEAEELANYAATHLKEDGEAVAAIIRANPDLDGDLALSLREMGDEALVEFAPDSADDQAKLKRALEELDKAVLEDDKHEHHGPTKDEEARLVKQARMAALKYKRKHPNELHIHLIKARNLLVMDEAMIMGKGSSDPTEQLVPGGHSTHWSALLRWPRRARSVWLACVPAGQGIGDTAPRGQ